MGGTQHFCVSPGWSGWTRLQDENKTLVPQTLQLFILSLMVRSLPFLSSLVFWTDGAWFSSPSTSAGCRDEPGALQAGSDAWSLGLVLPTLGNRPPKLPALSLLNSLPSDWAEPTVRPHPQIPYETSPQPWTPAGLIKHECLNSFHPEQGVVFCCRCCRHSLCFLSCFVFAFIHSFYTEKGDYYSCNYHGNNYHKVLIDQDRLVSTKG